MDEVGKNFSRDIPSAAIVYARRTSGLHETHRWRISCIHRHAILLCEYKKICPIGARKSNSTNKARHSCSIHRLAFIYWCQPRTCQRKPTSKGYQGVRISFRAADRVRKRDAMATKCMSRMLSVHWRPTQRQIHRTASIIWTSLKWFLTVLHPLNRCKCKYNVYF